MTGTRASASALGGGSGSHLRVHFEYVLLVYVT